MRNGHTKMPKLLEQAKKQLSETTRLKPVTVTRAFKDDKGWHVGVEMLEMSRIPSAADVLGDYEVLLDEDGSMIRFERKRTRLRCEPINGEGA